MPVVSIEADWLNKLLGREYATEELADSLEQIGCDVEDVVQIDRFRCPVCTAVIDGSLGAGETKSCMFCGHEAESEFRNMAEGSFRRRAGELVRCNLL